jgi:hypothetical protein
VEGSGRGLFRALLQLLLEGKRLFGKNDFFCATLVEFAFHKVRRPPKVVSIILNQREFNSYSFQPAFIQVGFEVSTR